MGRFVGLLLTTAWLLAGVAGTKVPWIVSISYWTSMKVVVEAVGRPGTPHLFGVDKTQSTTFSPSMMMILRGGCVVNLAAHCFAAEWAMTFGTGLAEYFLAVFSEVSIHLAKQVFWPGRRLQML